MCLGGDGDMHCSNLRILYVEDHADTRDLVSYVLTGANYVVALAENPEQATLLAKIASFDLYLIDNWMPGMSRIDLCSRLREFDADTPILFYSGAAYEEDKRAALAAGAQGYLS
jgi:CheY-like chemotaxis protein